MTDETKTRLAADLVASALTMDQPLEDVVTEVRRTVGEDETLLADWWAEYGEEAVLAILGPLRSAQGNGGTAAPPRRPYLPKVPARPKSWRERFRKTPELVLDLALPVGGELKKYRELTPADIQVIESGYNAIANVATSRAEQWGRIRRKLTIADTIGSAIDAGRLKAEELLVTGLGEPLEVTHGE